MVGIKRSTEEVNRVLADIRNNRKGKSEKELMEFLAIPERTFRRYLQKIYAEDKKVWNELSKDRLESELLNLKASLEETYKIARDLAINGKETEEILAACTAKDDARLSIVQLLRDGPAYINVEDVAQVKRKLIVKSETKTR